jgi:hypothetical protein
MRSKTRSTTNRLALLNGIATSSRVRAQLLSSSHREGQAVWARRTAPESAGLCWREAPAGRCHRTRAPRQSCGARQTPGSWDAPWRGARVGQARCQVLSGAAARAGGIVRRGGLIERQRCRSRAVRERASCCEYPALRPTRQLDEVRGSWLERLSRSPERRHYSYQGPSGGPHGLIGLGWKGDAGIGAGGSRQRPSSSGGHQPPDHRAAPVGR